MNDLTDTKQEEAEGAEEGMSRRKFLGVAGAAVGALTVAQITTLPIMGKNQAGHGSSGKHKWGMVIDLNTCIGCSYCTYACQAVNNLPDEMQYNNVTTEHTQNGDEYFLARPCLHCENAPCVQVCPVGATFMRDDGIVTMDYDMCIGCRYCELACPYDARVFNWKENTMTAGTNTNVPDFGYPEVEARPRGVVEKCTFCEHRIDAGMERGLMPGIDEAATPACVVVCPTNARIFGDLNDPESPTSKSLAAHKTPIVLRPELSTQPKVYYIPPADEKEEV